MKRAFHHSFLALITVSPYSMGCAHALVSCFKRDKRIHRGSGWDIPGDRTEPPAMVLHSKKILRERYCNDGFFWDRFRWGSAIERGCPDRSACILLGKGNVIFLEGGRYWSSGWFTAFGRDSLAEVSTIWFKIVVTIAFFDYRFESQTQAGFPLLTLSVVAIYIQFINKR